MQPRPYVLINMAVTADGKIDTVERQGARISGAADTTRVDRLRSQADAIMVGGHTLLREDPRLTVRDGTLAERRIADGRPAQPTKIGVVTAIGLPGEPLSLPEDSRFLTEGGSRVIICTTGQTDSRAVAWLRGMGAIVTVHETERVDLRDTLAGLVGLGIERLMVEGGSTLAASLLDGALVDEVQLAIAPLIFGGADAPTPVGGPGRSASDAIKLELASTDASDDGDVVLRYRVEGARD